MTLALYQIIVPLLCLLLIAKACSHFLRKEKTLRELIGWIFFWGSISIIAFFPSITESLAQLLGIKSNVNAILFTVMGVLSYIVFKLVVGYEDTQRDITRLTRAQAIEKYLSKDK